jgi:plastocyanin
VTDLRVVRIAGALLSLMLVLVAMPARSLTNAGAAVTLVIGVDHVDSANQQPFPPFNRVFEYSDFFSRQVTVHQGDTIDFRTAPFSFHSVALAKSESTARQVYPFASAATGQGAFDTATGSGAPKLVYGAANFPVTGGSTQGGGVISTDNPKGPPVCGVAALGQAPCHFRGGDDIEIIGPAPGFTATGAPQSVDQNVVIDAPPGTYAFYDTLHPGMSGKLIVASPSQPASTQAQIDAAAQTQFQQDQAQALQVEAALNAVQEGWGQPGQRQFVVFVGAGAANNHVQIDEMLPNKPLSLTRGDTVTYLWADPHAGHTLAVTPDEEELPGAVGYDCPSPTGYVGITSGFDVPPTPAPAGCLLPGLTTPRLIGDPGDTPPFSPLTDPERTMNAGHLLGSAYGITPSSQVWGVTTNSNTQAGTYEFVCSIHDWMVGRINI